MDGGRGAERTEAGRNGVCRKECIFNSSMYELGYEGVKMLKVGFKQTKKQTNKKTTTTLVRNCNMFIYTVYISI